jgi:hypothetical protein
MNICIAHLDGFHEIIHKYNLALLTHGGISSTLDSETFLTNEMAGHLRLVRGDDDPIYNGTNRYNSDEEFFENYDKNTERQFNSYCLSSQFSQDFDNNQRFLNILLELYKKS